MLQVVLSYSDLTGGFLGIFGSIVLAYPKLLIGANGNSFWSFGG
jgi:hypothetical protein